MNHSPLEYLRILAAIREPQFLVSAWDIANASPGERAKILKGLADARARGAKTLLDSGNYESYWHRDKRWSASRLHRILRSSPCSIAFSFDDQNPPASPERAARGVLRGLEGDQVRSSATVAPIVHGSSERLPKICRIVAERSRPLMLAVPERELGDGIVARARSVLAICRELREVAPECILHLLGTGNPISILIFSCAGAESFDGLEWCQTYAEESTARLYHFHQRDLLTPVESGMVEDMSYRAGTLIHNLLFFRRWMERVRAAVREQRAVELLKAVAPTVSSSVISVLEGA